MGQALQNPRWKYLWIHALGDQLNAPALVLGCQARTKPREAAQLSIEPGLPKAPSIATLPDFMRPDRLILITLRRRPQRYSEFFADSDTTAVGSATC